LRFGQHHLVSVQGAWQLFDLKADPGEEKNLAAEKPELVKQMAAAYDQWWQEILPCLDNEDARGPRINPFKELYWKQFGGEPSEALLKQMDPEGKFKAGKKF
jgi:arylsulfatase